jgi:general stress protein 26
MEVLGDVTPYGRGGSMLGPPVTEPLPPPRVEHLQGLQALPRLLEALVRFEPAVLVSADGRGALYAALPGQEGRGRLLWLLADARTVLDWEASRHHPVVLTFLSRDERVFAQVSGVAEPVVDPAVAGSLWRASYTRWFPGGPSDPRLLILRFDATSADFYEAPAGRVSAHVPH